MYDMSYLMLIGVEDAMSIQTIILDIFYRLNNLFLSSSFIRIRSVLAVGIMARFSCRRRDM